MQNENNKNGLWKQKLDDTNFSSAEMRLNKEAAWQKLQQRMHKPKRKKAIVYWFVAACVLPLLIVVSWVLQQKKSSVVKGVVYHQKPITKPFINETLPARKDVVVTAIKLKANEKKTAFKKITTISLVIDTNKETGMMKSEDPISKNNDVTVDVVKDSAAVKPIAMQVKKKLFVVHINDLGEPMEALPVADRSLSSHSFSLQIAKEDIFIKPTKIKYKPGFISLPARSSSN